MDKAISIDSPIICQHVKIVKIHMDEKCTSRKCEFCIVSVLFFLYL